MKQYCYNVNMQFFHCVCFMCVTNPQCAEGDSESFMQMPILGKAKDCGQAAIQGSLLDTTDVFHLG